jgi:hypothetical protein
MGRGVQGKQTIVEDFVVVSIHHHVVEAGPRAHESIPGFRGQEAIMKDNCGVLGRLTGDTPGIIVVLFEAIQIHATRNTGLIKSLNGGDYVSIATISRSKRSDGVLGVLNSVSLLPVDGPTLSTVVKAILGSRGCSIRSVYAEQNQRELYCRLTTVQVNHHLQSSSASPANCLIEELQLAVNIRIALEMLHSPISDGDSNVIHASSSNLVEVVLSNKSAPML